MKIIQHFEPKDWHDIIINVLGGIVVAALSACYIYARNRAKRWKQQKIFGRDLVAGLIHIIYGKFCLHPRVGGHVRFPYIKPPRPGASPQVPAQISIDNPVSGCETRGAKYVSSMLGDAKSLLVADLDEPVISSLDMSFISLGGEQSNYKSADAMRNPANNLVRIAYNGITDVESNRALPLQIQANLDYGLILRIRPQQFPKRVWIVCAGFGEWGTSGSAWFLANRWNKLLPWYYFLDFGDGWNFAAIIKVDRGQDESATLVKIIRSRRDIGVLSDVVLNTTDEGTVATTTAAVTANPGASISLGTNMPPSVYIPPDSYGGSSSTPFDP